MSKNQNLNIHNLITQSNKLIESRYNLNITEQRLILAMISMINPDDEDFREYNIKIATLNKVLGLKSKNIYSEIKNITENIMTKVIKIKKPRGVLQINWISSADYNDDLGTVTLKFDPSLKPYLLNIKENYTSTRFGITAKFKSFYTTRIYMLVKQYERIGKRIVSIDFLQELFPQYESYKDIKRRILIPSQKEICEVSDIRFEIKENKLGRKVNEVIFYNIKPIRVQGELPLFLPTIKSSVSIPETINRKYKVDLSVAEKIVNEIDVENKEEEFNRIFKYIDSNIINRDIKNIAGFVVDCIRKGYYKESQKLPEESVVTDIKLTKISNVEKAKINNEDTFFLKFTKELKKNSEEAIYEKWLSKLNFLKNEKGKLVLATLDNKLCRDWIIREYLSDIIYPCAENLDKSITSVEVVNIIKQPW